MHLGYNLTWDSFPEHLGSIFQDLSNSNRFSDVTLICDDQKLYKSHKFILSASSDVFKAIFSDESQSPPMIYLRGVSHKDLELILSFVYTGQVTFEQERLSEFLNVAKDLKIYGIENSTDSIDELDMQVDKLKSEEDIVDSSKDARCKDALSEMLPLDSEKLFNPKDPQKRKAQCPTCLKVYNNKTKLKIHYENKHEGVRWPCNQCDKQFGEKSILHKHMRAVHGGVRFICKLCDYEAPCQRSLKHHMYSHNTEEIN